MSNVHDTKTVLGKNKSKIIFTMSSVVLWKYLTGGVARPEASQQRTACLIVVTHVGHTMSTGMSLSS